ncbi:MAG: DUF3800 domain-containing protein [Desulfobacula sp.]|jgi:hypothetical protein
MFFYVDESGQTGLNLFDEDQPHLYYGVLSCKSNLDILARPTVKSCRKKLGIERLHANEIGNAGLVKIVDEILRLKKKRDLRFDFFKVNKVDHAMISFFDQVFDQGLNPAVPYFTYWSPLRYVMLIKLAHLFDVSLLKKAWEARISTDQNHAEKILFEVCETVLQRVKILPDERSQMIISDTLKWAISNPSKLYYNVANKKQRLQISPNLIGFQSVMHGIALRLKTADIAANKVIIDRQSQFNKAQEWIANFYRKGRDKGDFPLGIGLPVMNLEYMPDKPIECLAGTKSIGLEIVDVYIWVFKRWVEKKELAPELYELIRGQIHKGHYDEISLNALQDRWGKWFNDLPEPTEEQIIAGRKLCVEQEVRRHAAMNNP